MNGPQTTDPATAKAALDFAAAQRRLASRLHEADLQHARRQVHEAERNMADARRKLDQANAALNKLDRRA